MNAVSAASGTPSAYPSHGPPAGYTSHDAAATAAAALSQHHMPVANSTTTNGRKRRSSGQPGSRGVANLTPEQLAKKRANDREAQRAIRERTRNTIESLERRIRELESQQPFQELQRAIAERDRAINERDELRQRMGMVAQVIGVNTREGAALLGTVPAGAGQGAGSQSLNDPAVLTLDPADTELAALTAQQSPLPPIGSMGQQQAYPSQYDQQQAQHIHPALRSPHVVDNHTSPESQTTAGSPMYGGQYPQQANGYEHQRPLPPPQQQQSAPQHNGERLGLNFLLDSTQSNTKSATTNGQAAVSNPTSPQQPSYACLPSISAPTCPLDALLTDFISSRRQLLRNGTPMHEVLGPDYPSFLGLHNPQSRQNSHPVSALLIDILSKFPDICNLPEKVAVLYIMFLIMRWFICPCEGCFERLPEWVRPVADQVERQHATWIDNLPWFVSPFSLCPSNDLFDFEMPEAYTPPPVDPVAAEIGNALANTFILACRPHMRRRLSTTNSLVNFDEFFVPYTTTLSLNWPYPTEQVLISASGRDSATDVELNPVFETHLRDLRNWSLGEGFRQAFPDLVEDVRIEDRGA